MAEHAIRLFFDENMPVEVANQLNDLGIDTVTTRDLRRLGLGDPSQFEFATSDGRVICTYDKHYIEMAQRGLEHVGIVFIPGMHRDYGVLLRYFIELNRVYTAADMINRLEYLSPSIRD